MRRSVLAACALAFIPLFSGGSCTTIYCSEDCDPCVSVCKCPDTTCDNRNAGFEEARKLESYERLVGVEPDGRTTVIYARIFGISIERALGKPQYDSGELRAFAESVVVVNDDLFGLRSDGSRWAFESMDVFETAQVVTLRARGARTSEGRTLTLLFDAAGSLLEIDDTRP